LIRYVLALRCRHELVALAVVVENRACTALYITRNMRSDLRIASDRISSTGNSSRIRKKVCVVGANGVGKTSLVRRYVDNLFEVDYCKMLGASVSKATVMTRSVDVSCVIWDVDGDEHNTVIRPGYFRGMSGFLLFVDGTCHSSVARAGNLIATIENTVGPVPFVLLLNKADLKHRWTITSDEVADLSSRACMTLESSAKTGAGVIEAFEVLANAMLAQDIRLRSVS